MICPSCGHDNIAGDDECVKCRADLTHLDEPAAQSDMERLIMRQRVDRIKPVPPCTVSPDTSVGQVVDLLSANNIGAVLICEDDKTVGIFSERDLLFKIGVDYPKLRDQPIRDFMTVDPVTIESTDSIALALNRMDVGDYRHIPITEEGSSHAVTGIISVRDILRHLVSNAN